MTMAPATAQSALSVNSTLRTFRPPDNVRGVEFTAVGLARPSATVATFVVVFAGRDWVWGRVVG